MNDSQLELIEKYLDSVISRSKDLRKFVLGGFALIMAVIIVIGIIHYTRDTVSVVTIITILSILIGVFLGCIYTLFHLQACMNQCDIMKLKLGLKKDFDDIKDLIKVTKCTNNIDVSKIKEAITPINLINTPS